MTNDSTCQVLDTMKVFDEIGNILSLQITKDGIKENYILNYEYDEKNRLAKEYATDTLSEILPRIGMSEIIVYEYGEEDKNKTESIIYMNKEMQPTANDRYGFHKIINKYDNRNLKIEEWFLSKSGKTFQRIGFKYNGKDSLSEVNYLDELGNLKKTGLAIIKIEYDKEGRVIRKSNFDSSMTPHHTKQNPFLTETNYLNGIECEKYYDFNKIEIKSAKLSICEPIPEFQLPDKNENNVSINEINGKIKIIHFWASWSSPCKYKNKRLVDLHQKLKTNDVEIISIALEKEGEKENWINSIKESNLDWQKHLSDFQHWESKAVMEFGINSIPRYFIVDENGFLIGNNLRTIKEIEEVLTKKGKL